MEEEIIQTEKIKTANTASVEKKKRKVERLYEPITEEQYLLIKKYCKEKELTKHLIIFTLQFESGLRLEEALSLQRDNIKIKERKIHIVQGKGNKDRHTILGKSFKEEYLKSIPFINKKGKRLTKAGVQKAFTRITLELGFNKVIATYKLKNGKTRDIYKYHTHSLRHGFANYMLSKGTPVNVVQSMLGHRSISTTNRYTIISGDLAIQDAIRRGL